MPYATIDDIFSRYRPINTLVGAGVNQVSSVDISTIFIGDAESFIDAMISRRYEVPLDPVPQFITQIASDLTIFNVLVEKLPEVPDFFQPRYDRSLKMLTDVACGNMNVLSATVISSGDQEAFSTTGAYHPIFDPSLDPEDQRVDKDQVDAAKDARIGDVL